MTSREAAKKRRLAHGQGLTPERFASRRAKPDGSAMEAHEVELAALERIARGEQTPWDVLAAEALSERCFGRGCAFEDGAAEDCPGWRGAAIEGFKGWVMRP